MAIATIDNIDSADVQVEAQVPVSSIQLKIQAGGGSGIQSVTGQAYAYGFKKYRIYAVSNMEVVYFYDANGTQIDAHSLGSEGSQKWSSIRNIPDGTVKIQVNCGWGSENKYGYIELSI